MKIIENPLRKDWSKINQRPTQSFEDIETKVSSIFKEIQQFGDQAIQKYTLEFDKVRLDDLVLSSEEIEGAALKVPDSLKEAIALAKNNIEKFHAAQKN